MDSKVLTEADAERILDGIVEFPGTTGAFERVRPITDFRKDDYEARILYSCKELRTNDTAAERLYILKCKVQAPSVLAGGLTEPVPGPSEFSMDEIKALTAFTNAKLPFVPHIVAWKTAIQDDAGLMPGGYIFYNLMTLMPGENLMDLKFWSLSETQRREIRAAFIPVVKYGDILALPIKTLTSGREVWRLGFEPYDCALRNILWEAETKTISLVDFEHWYPTTKDPINMTERLELEKWGLTHRAAAPNHWMEWFRSEASTSRH